MPTLDYFDGIRILIYPNDHNPPHFHVEYAEHEALIEILTLKTLVGKLPSKIIIKVKTWAEDKTLILLAKFQELNPNLR